MKNRLFVIFVSINILLFHGSDGFSETMSASKVNTTSIDLSSNPHVTPLGDENWQLVTSTGAYRITDSAVNEIKPRKKKYTVIEMIFLVSGQWLFLTDKGPLLLENGEFTNLNRYIRTYIGPFHDSSYRPDNWTFASDSGVFYFNGREFKEYRNPIGDSIAPKARFILSDDNDVLVTTESSAFLFEKSGTMKKLSVKGELPLFGLGSIEALNSKDWMVISRDGLWTIKGDILEEALYRGEPTGGFKRQFRVGSAQWINIKRNGDIFLFKEGELILLKHELSQRDTKFLREYSRNSSLIVGSSGYYSIQGSTLDKIKYKEGSVAVIIETFEYQNDFLVVTDQGIYSIDGGLLTRAVAPALEKITEIHQVFDTNGQGLVASTNNGLILLSKNEISRLYDGDHAARQIERSSSLFEINNQLFVLDNKKLNKLSVDDNRQLRGVVLIGSALIIDNNSDLYHIDGSTASLVQVQNLSVSTDTRRVYTLEHGSWLLEQGHQLYLVQNSRALEIELDHVDISMGIEGTLKISHNETVLWTSNKVFSLINNRITQIHLEKMGEDERIMEVSLSGEAALIRTYSGLYILSTSD